MQKFVFAAFADFWPNRKNEFPHKKKTFPQKIFLQQSKKVSEKRVWIGVPGYQLSAKFSPKYQLSAKNLAKYQLSVKIRANQLTLAY